MLRVKDGSRGLAPGIGLVANTARCHAPPAAAPRPASYAASLRISPVRSVDGMRIGADEPFGPVTRRLIQGYTALVDCDFVEQYRRHAA